jgi:membrane protease YdiL (CAAX protease family)
MFGADVGWAEAPPRFLNLTLIGVLLALAYQRTGNLWFSISLHASWIFWLVAYRALTHSVPGVNAWFWGSRKIVDGWMALPVLAFTLFFFARFPLTGQTDSVRDKRQNSLCQN